MVRQLTARPTSIFKVDLFGGFFSHIKTKTVTIKYNFL